jgi:protein-S-isoprenylcysteine O-methyltransferase Ste14
VLAYADGVDGSTGGIVAALWVAWIAYWFISSRSAKSTERAETFRSRASHIVPLVFAGYLFSIVRIPGSAISLRMYPPHRITNVVEVVGVAFGLCFSAWARVHLGRNWSGIITIKRDHELIRSGPYAMVRHPIYTGLLLAFASMAIGAGTWAGVLGVLIVAGALVRKLRIEEQFMVAEFGDAYAHYRREVPALVPGMPMRLLVNSHHATDR